MANWTHYDLNGEPVIYGKTLTEYAKCSNCGYKIITSMHETKICPQCKSSMENGAIK